jgi:hypothetical protein
MMPNIRVLLLLAALSPAAGLQAQQTSGDPWAAFLGCWTPVESASLGTAPITCIIPEPETPAAARILTVRAGATLRDQTVTANGTRVSIDADECTGWSSARFSDSGARLYLDGETRCSDQPVVRSSGLYAILPNGDWLDVAGARAADGEQLQVQRSRIVPWFDLPETVVAALAPWMRSAGAARLAAGRPLRVDDVLDVSGQVDPGVAEVWLAEVSFEMREDALRVSARDLRVLAAASVPERVIDMLVAVANPDHFAVAVSERGASAAALPRAVASSGAGGNAFDGAFYTGAMRCSRLNLGLPFALSPFGFNGIFGFPMGMTGGLFDCFGGSPLAFDARYGLFGWSRAGMYGGYFPGYGRFPITVTVDRTTAGGPRPTGGRVIRGRGYSEGPSTGGSPTAQPRDASVRSSASRPRASTASSPSGRSSARPSGSSGRTSGSGASTSRGSSSGSSSSGSSGRTAKPRTP